MPKVAAIPRTPSSRVEHSAEGRAVYRGQSAKEQLSLVQEAKGPKWKVRTRTSHSGSRRVHKSGYIQDTCPVSGGFAPRYSLTHFHPNIYQIPPQTRWSVCTRSFPLCYPPAIRCETPTPPPGQIAPQTRKRTAGKRGGARKQTSGKKERPIEYIQVPKHWFADPLNHALKTVVRPPTKLSRRKELTIEIKLPLPIFIDLMKPMDNGDMAEFEWEDEKKEALKPTTDKKSNTEYKYTIAKPEKVDKCWRLQDREPLWRTRKAGKLVLSRRGLGSARLHLSTAAEDRGKKNQIILIERSPTLTSDHDTHPSR